MVRRIPGNLDPDEQVRPLVKGYSVDQLVGLLVLTNRSIIFIPHKTPKSPVRSANLDTGRGIHSVMLANKMVTRFRYGSAANRVNAGARPPIRSGPDGVELLRGRESLSDKALAATWKG